MSALSIFASKRAVPAGFPGGDAKKAVGPIRGVAARGWELDLGVGRYPRGLGNPMSKPIKNLGCERTYFGKGREKNRDQSLFLAGVRHRGDESRPLGVVEDVVN